MACPWYEDCELLSSETAVSCDGREGMNPWLCAAPTTAPYAIVKSNNHARVVFLRLREAEKLERTFTLVQAF